MKAHLTRRYSFPASHRLHSDSMSHAENHAIYGKCNNPHGHGHNYALEVTLAGEIDPRTGMVVNLTDLDSFVHKNVLEIFDHANLSTIDAMHHRIPTTENLCLTLFDILRPGIGSARLEKIRIEETAKNSFEYWGD